MTRLPQAAAEAGSGLETGQEGPLLDKYLSAIVTRYATRSGLGKVGSCQLFRRTCATLMLEHGADIRHMQEQLGHACLLATQICTPVSIRKPKEVHAATHPRATLSRPDSGLADTGDRA